jgi:peptidoglycan/LPS O-acetylase OafA/YrhL
MALEELLAPEKKTTSGLYLKNITGLRALAVIWVTVFHAWIMTGGGELNIYLPFNVTIGITRLIRLGEWGVDIFFVLSGFLLTTPLLEKSSQAGFIANTFEFYRRRALRILPAYYFILLVMLYLCLFSFAKMPSTSYMFGHVLFVNAWWDLAPLRGVFWSLPVEVTFYLVLPFLVLAIKPKKWMVVLFVSMAFTIVFRVFIIKGPIADKGFFLFSFLGRVDQFALGMACAYLFKTRNPTSTQKNLIFLAGLIGLLWTVQMIGHRGNMLDNLDPMYYFHPTIVAFFVALLIFGAAAGNPIANVLFGNAVMVFIGTISFSIYLWHTIFINAFTQTGLGVNLTAYNRLGVTLFYIVPPLVAASFLTYLLIERPFLRIRHHLSDSRPGTVARYPIWTLAVMGLALVALTALANGAFRANH